MTTEWTGRDAEMLAAIDALQVAAARALRLTDRYLATENGKLDPAGATIRRQLMLSLDAAAGADLAMQGHSIDDDETA